MKAVQTVMTVCLILCVCTGTTMARNSGLGSGIWEVAKLVASSFGYNLESFVTDLIDKPLVTLSTKPSSTSLHTYEGVTNNSIMGTHHRSAYVNEFNDNFWTYMWYVQDYRRKDFPVMDLNVVPVYRKIRPITGRGVKVAVVDDGVQHDHPDIVANYEETLAYNVCDDQPGAALDPKHTQSHGTMCAGVIAMQANNKVCGVGIAYNAKVAGLIWNCKKASEYTLAATFVKYLDRFDIYSNSWGPADNGMLMASYGDLVKHALAKGVTEGRNGKGAIYTFASGNGGHQQDHCGADAMVNVEVTFSIAAASQWGKAALFGERCAGILATTYGGNLMSANEEKIVAPDIDTCLSNFAGTSVATPLATGIIALVLEANPDLTYRDVMHIITMGAEVAPLANNDGWYRNAKGFWVNSYFGFGLFNAENMVDLAEDWTNVPKKRTCIYTTSLETPEAFKVDDVKRLKFEVDTCHNTPNEVNYLETVELVSNINYPYRGALVIHLISPSGTRTELLGSRPLDTNTDGLKKWSFKCLHHWGETPAGEWTVEVVANAKPKGWRYFYGSSGTIDNFTFKFHGTKEPPEHYSRVPRTYSGFRLPDGTTSES